MNTLYLILYLLAAVCFVIAAFFAGVIVRADPAVPPQPSPFARVNLVALGLFFWVLVPLIQTIRAM